MNQEFGHQPLSFGHSSSLYVLPSRSNHHFERCRYWSCGKQLGRNVWEILCSTERWLFWSVMMYSWTTRTREWLSQFRHVARFARCCKIPEVPLSTSPSNTFWGYESLLSRKNSLNNHQNHLTVRSNKKTMVFAHFWHPLTMVFTAPNVGNPWMGTRAWSGSKRSDGPTLPVPQCCTSATKLDEKCYKIGIWM